MATHTSEEILPPFSYAQPLAGTPAQAALEHHLRRSTSGASLYSPVESENPDRGSRDHINRSTTSVSTFSTVSGPPPTESAAETFAPTQFRPPRAKLSQSLGSWGSLVIIGGGIGLLAVYSFISFLWLAGGTSPEAVTASRAWLNIILNDRITQAVTLSSLLLRLIASSQGASCTSLLAALFLERRAVRVSQLPHFSIARAVNDGPRQILQMIIGSHTRHTLLTVEALLIMVLTLVLIGLQFSSTILLADLRSSIVVDSSRPISLNTSFSDNTTYVWDVYNFNAPALATYGEVLSNSTAMPDNRGMSDTGLKQRALLPLPYSENRTAVRSYQGPTFVGNSRVACMPPIIDGTLEARLNTDVGRLQGTLDYNASLRATVEESTLPHCLKSECEPLLLDCHIPALVDPEHEPQSSICIAGGVGGEYWPREHGPSWKSTEVPWALHSPIFLVFSTNMRKDEWRAVQRTALVPEYQQQEWAVYKPLPTHYVNVSMCFVSFNIVEANVSMTAAAPLTEPKGTWQVPGTDGSGTVSYRRLLGTDLEHQSHGDRGILTLNNPNSIPISDFSKLNENQTSGQFRTNSLEWSVYFGLVNGGARATRQANVNNQTSIIACSFCATHGVGQHKQIGAIFTDTINRTKRAALAMESWLFMQFQTTYNEFIPLFDVNEVIKIGFTRQVETPRHCWEKNGCRGFIAVSILIGVHLICVTCITALYLTKIRYSRHGNIWHTVSQLQNEELNAILLMSNNAGDDEVSKMLKSSSADHCMRINMSTDGSRIEPVKYGQDPAIARTTYVFPRIKDGLLDICRGVFAKRNKKL